MNGESGLSVLEEEAVLQREGLADELMRKQLVEHARVFGKGKCVSAEQAKRIMGENCFGIFEAIRFFDAQYTPGDLARLSVVPFSEETLRACQKTHILFAGHRIDLIGIREKMTAKLWPGRKTRRGDFSYDEEIYAGEKKGVTARWYLIKKSVLPGSLFKSYGQQEAMLDLEVEERPSAAEVTYMVAMHMMAKLRPLLDANGQCSHKLDLYTFNAVVSQSLLFESCGVWVRGRDSRGCAVIVGFTEVHKGVAIGNSRPWKPSPNVGLVPSIKPTEI